MTKAVPEVSVRERDWWLDPRQERFTDDVEPIPNVTKDGELEDA